MKPALREQAEGRAPSRGLIVDTSGRVLGRHSGIERFTVGQRKGLGVSSDRRLYVVAIDAAIDRVVVGEEHELYAQELTASECSGSA